MTFFDLVIASVVVGSLSVVAIVLWCGWNPTNLGTKAVVHSWYGKLHGSWRATATGSGEQGLGWGSTRRRAERVAIQSLRWELKHKNTDQRREVEL